jgi:hypothetical protein
MPPRKPPTRTPRKSPKGKQLKELVETSHETLVEIDTSYKEYENTHTRGIPIKDSI